MKRRILKSIFIVVLIFTAFHLSGVEAAFCDDGATSTKSSHGCTVCHSGGHSLILEQSAPIRVGDFVSPAFVEYSVLKTQEPAFYFFRPPISL